METNELVKTLLTDLSLLNEQINIIKCSNGASTCIKIASSKSKAIMKKYHTTEYKELIKTILNSNIETL